MVKRAPRLAAAVLVSGVALLLSGALGGCELLLDTSKLSEANPDATSGDGSGSSSGSSSGGMDGTSGDAADATTDGSSSGGDASDSGAEVGPSDAPPCTGPLYYVSTNGNDANPGCSPTAPKKTIAAGIAAAKAYTASPPTIEVCAGSYAESNLKLDFAGSLRGGFDCSTWAADGGASATSTITNASPATQSATLVMFGSAVKLDGFTIQGAASVTTDGGTSSLTYSAVEITGTGSATISNNVLTGGSGAGGAPASAGIWVNGPSPLIENNTISGGSGAGGGTAAAASVGIFVDNGGAPVIRGNTIDGGSGNGVGTSASGSAGVMSHVSAGDITLVGNTIGGGSGVVSNLTSSGTGSTAVWLSGSPNPVPALTVTGNVLTAGTGSVVTNNTTNGFAVRAVNIGYAANVLFAGNTVDGGVADSGGSCPWAVQIAGTAAVASSVVTVSGNRIHAGHCTANSPNLVGSAETVGLHVNGPITSLVVEKNMIDGGQTDAHRYGTALNVNGVAGATIRHNTLIAGESAEYAFALWLENGALTTGTAIENNILGAIGPNAVAIISDNAGVCLPDGGAPGVSSFQNNLVFGNYTGFMLEHCSGNPVVTTFDAMLAAFAAPGVTVAGNLTIASSCAASDGGTLAGCIPMLCAANGGSCLSTVFAGWDDAGSGYGNLFFDGGFEGGCPAVAPPVIGGIGDGWALATGDAGTPPCLVARSTLNDVPDGAVDLYGNCRGAHPSMGAAEYPPGAACY